MAAAPTLALGAKIWVPDKDEVWQKATVVRVEGNDVIIRQEKDDEEAKLTKVYHLRNEEHMTSHGIAQLDDLTQLTHLHEAALLHSLNDRFEDDRIYTFTGPILIAVNPFKTIKGLYDETTLKYFIEAGAKELYTVNKKPHVFSTAMDAFRGLCQTSQNQTILISGESGAGKTESTKFVMKLLAMAGTRDLSKRSPIENQVLQSNPLLEAFGNAKTLRNDNSSRFGKFIEMAFALEHRTDGIEGLRGRLVGASIQTYLLETVRVCRQLANERNYHAFYQLSSFGDSSGWLNENNELVMDAELGKRVGVEITDEVRLKFPDLSGLRGLRYIDRSGCNTLKGVDDVVEFVRTAVAMQTVGLSPETQISIWLTTAAILLLGNLQFSEPQGNSEASCLSEATIKGKYAERCADFLGISTEELVFACTMKVLKTKTDNIRKNLTVSQAEDVREAMARALYGCLFKLIVSETNAHIGFGEKPDASCGVLDIFGFECFDLNSFEQLCINYTNERLQHFFNHFIFECEEALYRKEGISWDPLDFPDNEDCLKLISSGRDSILPMLDDECKMPKGSEENFVARMKRIYEKHPRFAYFKTKPDWFSINHFAGSVHYCVKNWMDKNRDELHADVIEAIQASRKPFVADLFTKFMVRHGATADPKKKKEKPSVSLEFRSQLDSLMNTVRQTSPHFIRCVKPNPRNKPDVFHRKSVAEQLRYAGVLQAVQVSRAGYPVRDDHHSFYLEYRALLLPLGRLREVGAIQNSRERVQKFMEIVNEDYKIPPPKHGSKYAWAVGETKVFLKHEAYEILSSQRTILRHRYAVKLQAQWRRFLDRDLYLRKQVAACYIQRKVRMWLAQRELHRRREDRAARRITRCVRRTAALHKMERTRKRILLIQACVRRWIAQRYVRNLKEHRAATKVQTWYRMSRQKRSYQTYRRKVIRVQLRWRQRQAVRELRRLKIKAKDANNLQAEKQALTDKLAMLQEQFLAVQSELQSTKTALDSERETVATLRSSINDLKETAQSSDELTTAQRELEEARARWQEVQLQLETAQQTLAEQTSLLETKNRELELAQETTTRLEAEKNTLLSEREAIEAERQQEREQWEMEKSMLLLKSTAPTRAPSRIPTTSETASPVRVGGEDSDETFGASGMTAIPSSLGMTTPSPPREIAAGAEDERDEEGSTPIATASFGSSVAGTSRHPPAPTPETIPSLQYLSSTQQPSSGKMDSSKTPTGDSQQESGDEIGSSKQQVTPPTQAPCSALADDEVCAVERPVSSSPESVSGSRPVDSGDVSTTNVRMGVVATDPAAGYGEEHRGRDDTTTTTSSSAALMELQREVERLREEEKFLLQTIDGHLLEIATQKQLRHQAEEDFQSVIHPDPNSLISTLVKIVSPSPEPATDILKGSQLKGDILLIGEADQILNSVVRRLTKHEGPFEPLTTRATNERGWLTQRETSFQLPGQEIPLSVTVLNSSELDDLSLADQKRVSRHFRYVGLCVNCCQVNQLDDWAIKNPLWSKVSPDCRRLIVLMDQVPSSSGEGQSESVGGGVDSCPTSSEWTRLADNPVALRKCVRAGVTLLTPEDFETVPAVWASDVRASRDLTYQDLHSLRGSPTTTGIQKQKSAQQKTQAGTLNEMLMQSLSSIWGVGTKRTLGRGGRSGRVTTPPVAELLHESLQGNESLLHDSRDREKAKVHGEITRWQTMTLPVKTAVTCIKFAKPSVDREFHLLAVATKAGMILTYKIRLTPEDRELLAKEVANNGGVDSRTAAADKETSEWWRPPTEPVEKWKVFEGHTKAVTSLFFTNDGMHLASTSIDSTVRFWDLQQGYLSKIFSDSVPILVAAYLPTDPRLFLTSNQKQVVRVVDSHEGNVVQRIRVDAEIRAICFDTSGLNLIAGTKDGSVEAYEVAENNRLQFVTKLHLTGANQAAVTCVTFCPGSQPTVVVNYCDQMIAIVKCQYSLSSVAIRQLSVKQRLKIQHTCVPLMSRIVPREDQLWLVSGSEDSKIKIFSRPAMGDADYVAAQDLRGHEHGVLAVDVNQPATILASADVAGLVQLWRRVTYKHLQQQQGTTTASADQQQSAV